jgi:hypothetical protein
VHDEADLADAFEQALNAKKSLVLDVCTGNFDAEGSLRQNGQASLAKRNQPLEGQARRYRCAIDGNADRRAQTASHRDAALLAHKCQRLINPMISMTTKIMTNMKNSSLAMLAAPAAIPPKPNTAATMAMMKNIRA